MPAPAETVVLARVFTGWTGYVAITIGSTTAIIRPRPRTSAAEVWREVGRGAARVHGNPTGWRTLFDATGKAVIEGPAIFTLALGENVRSRLGWSSASYSGAAGYTANNSLAALSVGSDPDSGNPLRAGVYTAGMGVNLEPGAWEQGSPHASSEASGGAVTHPLAAWAAGDMRFDAAMSQLLAGVVGFNWKSEALGLEGPMEWDVSFQGRLIGRVRIGATRIETRARGAGNLRAGLHARLQEVR